jgi:GH24 family phage-related lysozyme (muramidase)
MAMAPLSPKGRDLIFHFEGVDQPSDWPGAASGITIGYGYDLGQESAADFNADWTQYLPAADFAALYAVIGLKGTAAQAKASSLKGIRINQTDSESVFLNRSVPKYQAQTEQAFPGVDQLPADAQAALLSLVYNRGPSMSGDRRTEMRAIREAVPAGDLKEIADQLRLMKRLWEGQGLDGLLKRRDAEADLVESCIPSAQAGSPA